MKLGLHMGYWNKGPYHAIEVAKAAEQLGYDSLWAGEAYGSDAITPLAWLGSHTHKIKLGTAVMQLSARTPAAAAMTAMTLDHLTEGRFICGIGVSGPQVVEGWYGQPFKKPLERTREWMQVFRQITARETPVEFHGNQYHLPYDGPDSMGLGKPLKLITHPFRKHIPVYMGAEGPKNIELATEIADGWFPIFISPYRMQVFDESLRHKRENFEIACMVQVNVNHDLKKALEPVKWMLGLYVGGMGSKEENFHKKIIERMGFDVQKVQDLYLAGKHQEAIEAVPDELADEISLSGPLDRIKERLLDWKKSPVTTLMIGRTESPQEDIARLRQFAELVL
jgi:F420-dependent oxidoreductase-like protein